MKKTKLILGLCLSAYVGFAQFSTNAVVAGTGGINNITGQSYGMYAPQPNNLGVAATAPQAINNYIGSPVGVAADAAGNFYYADNENYCIMKVNKYGIINLIAGTPGIGGYTDGIGSAAQFSHLGNICFDAVTGNLYVSDPTNRVIRMIQPTGGTQLNSNCQVSTIAGLWIGTPAYPTSCSNPPCNGSPANQMPLGTDIGGLVTDRYGDLLFADGTGIRKITNPTVSNAILSSVFYNNTSSRLSNNTVTSIAIDPVNGDLYMAGSNAAGIGSIVKLQADVNGRISLSSAVFPIAGANTTSLGDGGPALQAEIGDDMFAMAVDINHNVYFTDDVNNRVRIINTVGNTAGIINTVVANGSQIAGISAYGLATTSCGNEVSLYIADRDYPRILKLSNAVTFAPTVSVPTFSVCSGSVINATASSGSNNGITPDSYTWNLISTNSSWVEDGFGNVAGGTITNPGSNSITIPISTTGLNCNHNYILQVTATKNCPVPSAATSSTHLYINCSPAPVITGNTTICSGSSTTLCENIAASSPNTVNWTTSVSIPHGGHINLPLGSTACITESPTANTTYNVSVTNSTTGCVGTASQLVTVQNIAATFTLTATSIAGSNFLITATNPTYSTQTAAPGFGYSWDVKEVAVGNASSLVSGTEVNAPGCWQVPGGPVSFWGYQGTGTLATPCSSSSAVGIFQKGHEYVVTYIDWSNVCPATSYSTAAYICNTCRFSSEGSLMPNLTDAEILSIHKQDIEASTDIYPNPSSGNFTIETPFMEKQTLQVFDINGRMVLSQNMLNGKATVDASSLQNGVYNVSIISNESVVNKRVVITK